MGLTTVFYEQYHTEGGKFYAAQEWSLTFVERFLVAGRALWFYTGKLLFPARLTFIYPRWDISQTSLWQYFFPLTAIFIIFVLWRQQKTLGKAPLTAVLLFFLTLFPALGFFDLYPQRYSFVADHFQYLASIFLLVLFADLIFNCLKQRSPLIFLTTTTLLLLALGGLTYKQSKIYNNLKTLYTDTINKNPKCWMAHHNIGNLYAARGKRQKAIKHFKTALKLYPGNYIINANLARTFQKEGHFAAAAKHYLAALKKRQKNVPLRNKLFASLAKLDSLATNLTVYKIMLQRNQKDTDALNGMANTLAKLGKINEAINYYLRALNLNPNLPGTHFNLAETLAPKNPKMAFRHYKAAISLKPDFFQALNGLANLYDEIGKTKQAVSFYQKALKIKDDDAIIHNNLGIALYKLKRKKEAIRHLQKALQINPDYEHAKKNLEAISKTLLQNPGR